MPDVTSPLSYSVSCGMWLQNMKVLAGLLAFAHPRICLNLDTEIRHFLCPQGIFLDSLQDTGTSFPCRTQALGFWSCHQVNGRKHLLSHYQIKHPGKDHRVMKVKQCQHLTRFFACWHQANVLYSKQMCLVLNLLLHAVITRKKEHFETVLILLMSCFI